MAAGVYNFDIEQGTTFVQDLIWKDSGGVARNLTGYTAVMDIRSTVSSPTVLLTLSTANGKISITALTGTIKLSLTATETAGISWTTGVYDIELKSSTSVVTRLMKGVITIDPEVTRSS